MTWLGIILGLIFVVAAFLFNCWIIYTYSAPVFQEIQRVLWEKLKAWWKSEQDKGASG